MSDIKTSSPSGISFLGLLQVLLIGLKLTGHIGWSWWWVLAPTILSACLFVLVVALFVYLSIKAG